MIKKLIAFLFLFFLPAIVQAATYSNASFGGYPVSFCQPNDASVGCTTGTQLIHIPGAMNMPWSITVSDKGSLGYSVSPTLASLVPNLTGNTQYYVNIASGVDTNAGTSWTTSFKTISHAVTNCGTTPCIIHVAPGVYTDYTNRSTDNDTQIVADQNAIATVSLGSGGSSCTTGTQTLTFNQSGNTTATVSVTVNGSGVVTSVNSISNAGFGFTPAGAVPVTGANCVGTTINILTTKGPAIVAASGFTGNTRTWTTVSSHYTNAVSAAKWVWGVFDTSQPIGDSFFQYTHVFSAAACDATPFSWFADNTASGTMYVNTGGVAPGTGTFSSGLVFAFPGSTPSFLGNALTWTQVGSTNAYSAVDLVVGLGLSTVFTSGQTFLQTTSLALVQVTPFSWWVDPTTSTIYVNNNGSAPDSTVTFDHWGSGVGVGLSTVSKTKAHIWYDQNLIFLGGMSVSSVGGYETAYTTYFGLNNRYIEAPDSNGFSVLGTINTYTQGCIAANNFNDGFNYHGDTAHGDFGLAYSPHALEFYNSARNSSMNDQFDNLSNASTVHEYTQIVRIVTTGSHTKGGLFYDIWGSTSYNIGCVALGSTATDSFYNMDYVLAGNTVPYANATGYYYKCKSNGQSQYGMVPLNSSVMNVYFPPNGNPSNSSSATGTIQTYTPS